MYGPLSFPNGTYSETRSFFLTYANFVLSANPLRKLNSVLLVSTNPEILNQSRISGSWVAIQYGLLR